MLPIAYVDQTTGKANRDWPTLYGDYESRNHVSHSTDPKLFHFLSTIDEDLAAKARTKGCGFCGGVLHSARYPRKLRVGPPELNETSPTRYSFCCETCRKRTTPASVRFFERRGYPALVVVLLAAMQAGVTDGRIDELRESLGVARRTLQRWRRWWQEVFVRTSFWEIERARFMPPVEHTALPACLLERFLGSDAQAKLIQCLRFLAPLSVPGAGSLREGR